MLVMAPISWFVGLCRQAILYNCFRAGSLVPTFQELMSALAFCKLSYFLPDAVQ